HAMTNAEWAAIALLCYAQGQSPRGNVNDDQRNPSFSGKPAILHIRGRSKSANGCDLACCFLVSGYYG
ncbi:hypothetical protein EJ881_13380, partial [Klebsiella pneumoniae subsp. pneumoniae]